MKVAVIGSGAVGCLIGGSLAGTHDVTMVCRPAQLTALREGVRIEGVKNIHRKVEAATSTASLLIHDIVVICVKSYDTYQALQDCRRLIGPGTLLLVVQNGLDVLNVADRVGFARMNIGVASLGVTYLGPAHVRYAGKGSISVGNIGRNRGVATRLVQILRGAGFEAQLSDDVLRDVWRKAVINAAINPITALVRRPNSCILEDGGLQMLSRQLFQEAVSVGTAWKALRPGDVCFEDVLQVAMLTGLNRSSMLQDIERGKRTEIDSINGAICRLAPFEGMVPANRALCALVIGMEKGGI